MDGGIGPAGRRVQGGLDPLFKRLSRGPIAPLMAVAGAVALHAAFARTRAGATRIEVAIIATVAVVALMAAIAPLVSGQIRWTPPHVIGRLLTRLGAALPGATDNGKGGARLGRSGSGRGLAFAAAAALVIGGGYLAVRKGVPSLVSFASFNPFAAKIVEGRANVLAGDVISISGATIKLADIEAPELDQKCAGANKKRWACGEAAVAALNRLAKGRVVRCEVAGTDDAGRSIGHCTTGGSDKPQNIAAELVREGAVFSGGGLFNSMAALEEEARLKKSGLWKGEAERPSEYRAKVWETAAKAAPDGCPIKGRVAGDAKTYVLPWASSYGDTKVRTSRGERWFCSEAEATAAGWKIAGR
jgi:endonuclease YncB( thermonuclease family)/Flp pilus assembly pilin Flp